MPSQQQHSSDPAANAKEGALCFVLNANRPPDASAVTATAISVSSALSAAGPSPIRPDLLKIGGAYRSTRLFSVYGFCWKAIPSGQRNG
jgi:hypothetical protein